MSQCRPSLDEFTNRYFGDQIGPFARGLRPLLTHAQDVCRPTTIALTEREDSAIVKLASRIERELARFAALPEARPDAEHEGPLLFQENSERVAHYLKKPLIENARRALRRGFITERLFAALCQVAEVRNRYSHDEDPTAVRRSREYTDAVAALTSIDPAHTQYCVERMTGLDSTESSHCEISEVTSVAVDICYVLGVAFDSARLHKSFYSESPKVPAYFGFADAIASCRDSIANADPSASSNGG